VRGDEEQNLQSPAHSFRHRVITRFRRGRTWWIDATHSHGRDRQGDP
jgi:hypothetical protein